MSPSVSEPARLLDEHDEPHDQSIGERLNWLRAAVLGANDGIVSTAGIVIGVAAATTERSTILTAGLAGLAAGAMSMAVGEYVSVSTQRDTEKALLAKERRELRDEPEAELEELASFVSFTVGALVPLLAVLLVAVSARVPVTVVAVVAALLGTGWLSARLGSSPAGPAIRRNIIGGVLAMAVTYAIGSLVGTQVS